jgi:hypothetical protein
VLDAHTQWVVAVEGSYDPNAMEENVFASELAQVVRKWKDAGERELLDHLCEMRDRPPSLRRDLLAYLDALETEANKTPVYYSSAACLLLRSDVSPRNGGEQDARLLQGREDGGCARARPRQPAAAAT